MEMGTYDTIRVKNQFSALRKIVHQFSELRKQEEESSVSSAVKRGHCSTRYCEQVDMLIVVIDLLLR